METRAEKDQNIVCRAEATATVGLEELEDSHQTDQVQNESDTHHTLTRERYHKLSEETLHHLVCRSLIPKDQNIFTMRINLMLHTVKQLQLTVKLVNSDRGFKR